MSATDAAVAERWPLMMKELRTRMRSRPALVTAAVYVLGLCGYVLWMYAANNGFGDALGSTIGTAVFRHLSTLQLILVLIACPLLTAAAVTGEKEQKTYDTLAVAPIGPSRIAHTKFLASVSYFLALLFVSLPLVSIAFILGGVDPGRIAAAYATAVAHVMLAGAIGFYWSTRFERSAASITAAAVSMTALTVLLPLWTRRAIPSLAALSPMTALNMLHEGALLPVLGQAYPSWTVSVVLSCLAAAGLLHAGVVRLHFEAERRYVYLRFMLLVFLLALWLAVTGAATARTGQGGEALLVWVTAAAALLAPWIGANHAVALSDRRSRARRHHNAPVRWLRAGLLSGTGFVFLLAVGAAGILFLNAQTSTLPCPAGERVMWTGFAVLGIWALSLSLVSGLATARKTRRGKWIALSALYVAAALLLAVPPALFHAWSRSGPVPVAAQVLYLLSPSVVIHRCTDPGSLLPVTESLLRRGGVSELLWATAAVHAATGLLAGGIRLLCRPREDVYALPRDATRP